MNENGKTREGGSSMSDPTAGFFEELGRRGDKAGMRAFLERTASAAARCELSAGDGRCCATEARRVFLRALEGGAGT